MDTCTFRFLVLLEFCPTCNGLKEQLQLQKQYRNRDSDIICTSERFSIEKEGIKA